MPGRSGCRRYPCRHDAAAPWGRSLCISAGLAQKQGPRRGAGASADRERVLAPQMPVPLSATVLAAAPPPKVTFSVAVLLPVEVGLK